MRRRVSLVTADPLALRALSGRARSTLHRVADAFATSFHCHWPLVVVVAVAAFLLLASLGTDYLWEDEGDTAVLGATILRHGVPVAWDGVTFIAPDYGQRLTSSFVMVSHPWLQYYLAAASFAVFGESSWAARVPFALAGLVTIVVAYMMVMDLLRSRLAALSAAMLLTLNVQFLLYARQARNYSAHALLTCLLVWQFLRLDSWKRAATFAALGILLFHAHPLGLAAIGALGVLTLWVAPLRSSRRFFWTAAAVVGVYSVPWLAVSKHGYERNLMPLDEMGLFLPRLLQFIVELASVTPLLGLVALGVYVGWRRRRASKTIRYRRMALPRPLAQQPALILASLSIVAMEALVMAATHSRQAIWVEGLHQTPSLIPLILIVTGTLIATASASSPRAWAALMLIFGLTRIPQVTPWAVPSPPRPDWDPRAFVGFHVPERLVDRVLRTTQLHYVHSLFGSNPGVVARVSEFLKQHASPTDIIVTNYAWEPLYFHTRLPQALKVAPSFPIYAAVRNANLPDYVVSPVGVRWVVWRRAWPAFFPEQDLARLLETYRESGLSPRLAASVPETMYENRENIHFRRFARDTYVFPPYRNLPDTLIYRVETFDESIDHYRRQLAGRPDDVEALTGLGVTLVASGHLDQAVAILRRAAAAAPRNALAQRNLANALFDTRQIMEATGHAELAVRLKPDDALAYDVLGRALAVQGRLDEATRQFERARQLAPDDQDIRDHLEQLRRLSTPLSGGASDTP